MTKNDQNDKKLQNMTKHDNNDYLTSSSYQIKNNKNDKKMTKNDKNDKK